MPQGTDAQDGGLTPLSAAPVIRIPWHRRPALKGYLLLSPTLLVILAMLIAPLIYLVLMSFWTQVRFEFDRSFTLNNYETFFNFTDKPIYLTLLKRSLLLSLIATIAVLVLAYPMAYFLAFKVKRSKLFWLILITVPFWMSYLLRVYAWKIVLGFEGVINQSLINAGIVDQPVEALLYSPFSVTIVLAHAWMVFAVLPIFVSLEKIDKSLLEAAADLGDSPVRAFFRITLPLSMPGLISSALMVFIPTVGDYVTPSLVGGTDGLMLGSVIQTLFGKVNNWPMGAAVSLVMMGAVTALVCFFLGGTSLFKRRMERL